MKTSTNKTKKQAATNERLDHENHQYANTGGISENNRCKGFVPAFQDTNTGKVYRSCFANGLPAPIHILAGLPSSILNTIVSGFLLDKIFYTREQAASALRHIH